MLKQEDTTILASKQFVASIRPRGAISGFLVIVPQYGYTVYLPPNVSKHGPILLRMRCSKTILEQGAIFSAYMTKDRTIVLEDVVVWKNTNIWATETFERRWNTYMKEFVTQHFIHDSFLHSTISLAKYLPLQEFDKSMEPNTMEFVPNDPKQKRLICIPVSTSISSPTESQAIAKKETNAGPDVYTIWRSGEKLGYGLVKTLEVSKKLRALKDQPDIPVKIEWNKRFEKWEILDV
jgi:hypothetical protein